LAAFKRPAIALALRSKASRLAIIGVFPCLGIEGHGIVHALLCIVMEAARGTPYRLLWQEMLSGELLSNAGCDNTL
jgi:hypothetical protein